MIPIILIGAAYLIGKTMDGESYSSGGKVPLLAPNGKLSKLTPEQWHLVRTPAFKAWFGDWENDAENASKVVDEETKEPLVVYHGTKKRKMFYVFDYTKGEITKTDEGFHGKGYYFTPIKNYANGYSYRERTGDYGRTYECFLNIKKPCVTFDNKSKGINNNYDGLMVYSKHNEKLYELMVLNSTKIKLADGTNTTFDGSNPDIRYEEGGTVKLIAPNGKPSGLYFTEIYNLVRTPEFKSWFGDWEEAYRTKDYYGVSKIIDENGEPLICVHNSPNEFFEFDKYQIGSTTDAGFYGKGFYFSPNVGSDRYGEIEYNCFLNIKNPYLKQSSYRNYELNSDDLKNQDYDGVIVYPNSVTNFNFENGVDGCEEIVAYYSKQIKLGDGTNTTFDKYNSDIRYNNGGEVKEAKFDKVISASSRFKPSQTIYFDPPLVGLNGAKLTSYTWSYENVMLPNFEGELTGRRVSDWTQAEISADTGRDIVHKYTVEMPNGEIKNVSSESVPVLLGYIDRKEIKSFPNLVTASKTLAKQQMQLAILEAQEKEYRELQKRFENEKKPPVEYLEPSLDNYSTIMKSVVGKDPEMINKHTHYRMGHITQIYTNDFNYSTGKYEKKKMLQSYMIEDLTNTWIQSKVDEYGGKYPSGINDLRNRVERQKRKVSNILKK